MGAGQSSDGGAATPVAAKTSYYELLSIEHHATDEDIKRAYRRKALELHPDRNHGREEEATRLFAEIQAAYEVLSDTQERAWYDAHENEILHGDETGAGGASGAHFEANIQVTTTHDIVTMMKRFNRNVDFSDKPTGFFGFLSEFFEQLSKEESAAARWQDEEPRDYPAFGHKDDVYEGVVKAFYGGWSGFSTQKTFAWKDKWRLSDAPDRQVRRLMEKENTQLRKDAIREFNDAVRQLVSFVRKRDPRYTPIIVSDAERQKALRDAAAAQAARARAENESKLKATDAVPDWAKAREPDEVEEGDEEPEDLEEFECVACHKTFKSERQFEAHEKSKKHQKAVQALKRKMQKDNANLHLDETTSSGAATPLSDGEADVVEIEDATSIQTLKSDTGDLSYEVGELHMDSSSNEDTTSLHIIEEDDLKDDGSSTGHIESLPESDDQSSPHTEARNVPGAEDLDRASDDDEEAPKAQQKPKIGAAAKKRAKKAAQMASADSEELKFKCTVCSSAFPSKSRLFQHIRDNGHAALKSEGSGVKSRKGKR